MTRSRLAQRHRLGTARLRGAAALVVLLLGAFPTSLQAEEEVPPALRDEVEFLWVAGHVGPFDDLLSEYRDGSFTGRWPTLLRNHYWRSEGRPLADREISGLSAGARARHAAELTWLREADAGRARPSQPPSVFPVWTGGGDDPYPVLRALVEDRERRELRGHAGLPAESPLMRLADRLAKERRPDRARTLRYYTELAMQRVYTGSYKHEPAYAEADRQAEARANALMERNGVWALWSLLGFVLIPLVVGFRLLRRRT